LRIVGGVLGKVIILCRMNFLAGSQLDAFGLAVVYNYVWGNVLLRYSNNETVNKLWKFNDIETRTLGLPVVTTNPTNYSTACQQDISINYSSSGYERKLN
jgi:hypothetical protein